MIPGINIKDKIESNVCAAIKEFEERDDIVTRFGKPIIGYVDARHPFFKKLYEQDLNEHPKAIFQPGNTLVMHFIPYDPVVASSNESGDKPSEQWSRAFVESMWLAMKVNGVIRRTIDSVGRLSSCLNTPTDWDEKKCRENWSHKLAAYAAGMGQFGPAGCFYTEAGFAGRLSGISTDGVYADENADNSESFAELSDKEFEKIYNTIQEQCRHKGIQGVACPDEMIAACPGNAISPEGIDRDKCQNYCKNLDEHIPSPEVCGKCFRFGAM